MGKFGKAAIVERKSAYGAMSVFHAQTLYGDAFTIDVRDFEDHHHKLALSLTGVRHLWRVLVDVVQHHASDEMRIHGQHGDPLDGYDLWSRWNTTLRLARKNSTASQQDWHGLTIPYEELENLLSLAFDGLNHRDGYCRKPNKAAEEEE